MSDENNKPIIVARLINAARTELLVKILNKRWPNIEFQYAVSERGAFFELTAQARFPESLKDKKFHLSERTVALIDETVEIVRLYQEVSK